MRLPDQSDEALVAIAKLLRGLGNKLLEDLPADGEPLRLESTQDLFAHQPATRIFQLEEGQLFCEHERKLIYLLEPGDVIGLSRSLQLPEGPYLCEGPVTLIPYQRDELVKHVNQSQAMQRHWAHYLLSLSSFFASALARETPGQFKPATGFLHFEPGDEIIRQGDQAECVYTLLEGSADAIHNGVKVGEVRAEEIFGAMAVFTGQPRNATVRATDSCSVLAVRKDEFLDLVAHHPKVCLSLIEEMAEKINQLNTQVLNLQVREM